MIEYSYRKVKSLISKLCSHPDHQGVAVWNETVNHFLQDETFKHTVANMRINSTPIAKPKQPGLPNVFCVGVQKTATSYLYSILRSHPKVSAYPKDLGLLDRLLESGSLENFTQFSHKIDRSKEVIIHFDVGYMFLGQAGISTIKDTLCTSPKIIICLRNPVDRILSEYRMRVRSLRFASKEFTEDLDFDEALLASNDRSIKNVNDYRNYYAYIENSTYTQKINDYINAFGRENVHIVVMEEDLDTNVKSSIANLFNFLSIFDADGFKLSLTEHRQFKLLSQSPKQTEITLTTSDNKKIYSPGTIEEIKGKNIARIKIKSDVPSQLSIESDNPSRHFLNAAFKLQSRLLHTPTHARRSEIYHQYFKTDIQKLEELLKRNLNIWYRHY